jgi:CheY-like chemotaxis protein
MIDQIHYDLVFMDCMMPEMDGFQATRAIRQREAANGDADEPVPIIALTANAMEGDRQACLDSGMDDYISKPVFLEKLRTCLQQWAPAAE